MAKRQVGALPSRPDDAATKDSVDEQIRGLISEVGFTGDFGDLVNAPIDTTATSGSARTYAVGSGASVIPNVEQEIRGTWIDTLTWKNMRSGEWLSTDQNWQNFIAAYPDRPVDIGTPLFPHTASGVVFDTELDKIINNSTVSAATQTAPAYTASEIFTLMGASLSNRSPANGTCNSRLMWEMNRGDWTMTASKFKQAWDIAVPLIRAGFAARASAMGRNQTLNIVFCPISDGKDYSLFYPNNANVDIIGLDVYASIWGTTVPAAQTLTDYIAGKLSALLTFATAKGKPMAIPEWGNWQQGTTGGNANSHGRGDFPDYIDQIFNFADANDVRYICYFNSTDGGVGQRINDTPLSLARYQERFAGGTGNAGPSYMANLDPATLKLLQEQVPDYLQQAALDAAYGAGGTAGPEAFIRASAYGWSTAASAATNNTAFTDAKAAAIAAKKPLFLDHIGTVNVSATLDLRATTSYGGGFEMFGYGRQWTVIQNTTDTATLLTIGGFNHYLHDFAIKHSSDSPGATTGDGIVFHKLAYSVMKRIQVTNTGKGFAIAQTDVVDPGTSTGSSNWMFSCTFEDINVLRYSKNALFLNSYTGRSTGSVWTNVYLQNSGSGGTRLTSTGNPIDLFLCDEMVFNQLNLEDHLGTPTAMLINSCGYIVVNGFHIERVALLNQYDCNYVRTYGGSGIVINGFSVAYCDVAPSGSTGKARLFSAAAAGKIIVNGINLNNVIKTTSGRVFNIADIDDTDDGNSVEVNGAISSNASVVPGRTSTATNAGLQRITGLDYQRVARTAVITDRSGSTYTPGLADAGNDRVTTLSNSSGGITVTIPTNASVPFPVGTILNFAATGTGQITFANVSSVPVLNSAGGALKSATRYASATLLKTNTDEWLVNGYLST